MNRRITITIRFMMDELIPPLIRDSFWFMSLSSISFTKGKTLNGKWILSLLRIPCPKMTMKAGELLRYFTLEKWACVKLGMDWIYTGYKGDGRTTTQV